MAAHALGPQRKELEQHVVAPEQTSVQTLLGSLRAVHDEAAETSELANLLGRSIYAGLLLPPLAILAVISADPPSSHAMSFVALVLAGAGALFYAHREAMRAPFDRAVLKAFCRDLDPILLYSGFAWGAGAFLILPPNIGPAFTVCFSGCTAAVVAMIVRSRKAVVMFTAPVGLLTALAALLRPLDLPLITATTAASACALVAGSVALSSWMKLRAAAAVIPSEIQPA